MAIATTQFPLFMPPPMTYYEAGGTTIDASGEKVALVGYAGKTGTISKLGCRLYAVTTAQTLKISLQGVDASGHPDGTIKASGNAYATQASPAGATNYTLTLTAPASVTINEPLAIVLEFDSTVGNVAVLSDGRTVQGYTPSASVYMDHYTAAWSKSSTTLPTFWAEYSDGTYCPPLLMPYAGTQSFGNANEWGNYFRLPGPMRAVGIWAYADLDETAYGNLYSAAGATLGQVTFSTTQRCATTRFPTWGLFAGGPVDLAGGTWYRMTMLPDSSTAISVGRLYLPSAAAMDGLPLGQDCYLTTRAGAGAWSQTTSERMAVGLVFSGVDDGAGSGGGSRAVILGG